MSKDTFAGASTYAHLLARRKVTSAAKADEMDDDTDAGKAKKAEADEDDKKDDDKTTAATRRERARCESIFASVHASGRPNVAARLAFKTDMSAKDAIGVMAAMDDESETRDARAAPPSDRRRMEIPPNPDIGTDAAAKPASKSGPAAFAAEMLRVDKIRRGEA